jgi:DNA replication and repair protein RecF
MHLERLLLRNFRNYKEAELEFDGSLNGICGDNGHGKTNLLEAIYLCITGRSFRTANLADLIRHGAESFFLEAHFLKHDVHQRLRIGYDGKERRIFHNETKLQALGMLLGHLRGVLLCPEDRELVSGGPSHRRRFLDLHLAQLDPLYLQHLARYHRALRQRNRLLRTSSDEGIEVWEEQMALSAAYLTEVRLRAIEELSAPAAATLQQLAPGEELTLTYKHSTCDKEALTAHRARERILGTTTIGPHRDDLEIHLNGRPARLFGSEGQKASCAMALKFTEWERLRTHSAEQPLFLIDDFTANLDEKRKRALNEQLEKVGQAFLALPHLTDANRVFRIVLGEAELLGEDVAHTVEDIAQHL